MPELPWIKLIAEEIADISYGDGPYRRMCVDEEDVIPIIAKHCPFKEGVAYMQIPRCDSCAKWATRGSPERHEFGQCMEMYEKDAKIYPDMYDGIQTKSDFGCVQWEAKA